MVRDPLGTILADLRARNPERRFARSTDGAALGVWVEGRGRFVMCLSKAVTGHLVWLDYELLVNGQPPYSPSEWSE